MKSNLTLLLVLFFPFTIFAQQVTTLNSDSGADDGIFFDSEGNLYGSHYMGSAVVKMNSDTWESEIYSDGFNTPNGLAFGTDGNLYMADNIGNKIYRILSDGTKEIFVNNIINPSGLILEPDSDTLVATTYDGSKIVKIATDGTVTEFSEGGMLNGPVGLCYDDEGKLYTGNFGNRKIIRLEENGDQVLISQAPGSGSLGFIAYANGYIYGTLFTQHKIYRTDLMGNDTIILGGGAGTVDGDAAVARFNRPNGIIASPSQDTLFVTDFETRSLRMITDLFPVINGNSGIDKISIKLSIYPNPVATETHLELELEKSGNVAIQLLDNNGKTITQVLGAKFLTQGIHSIPITTNSLASGMYHVSVIIDGESRLSKSLIKL